MNNNQYVNTLTTRHQQLDSLLRSELKRLNPNLIYIRQLKQKKLKLKDSIGLLKSVNNF